MFVINKSRWSKIILLLLIFTIFEKGWVGKIRPAVEMGAIIVTQEALSAVALATSFLWRAYTNSHDSAVDHLFGQEIDRLANHNGVSGAHSTVSANTPQQLSHISVQQEKPASTIKPVTTVQQASSAPITKSVATVPKDPLCIIKNEYYKSKHDDYVNLARKYFAESYAKYYRNPEYLFYVGVIVAPDPYIFNPKDDFDYMDMIYAAFALNYNTIFEGEFTSLNVYLTQRDQANNIVYAKNILNDPAIQKQLDTKGVAGEYVVGRYVAWAKKVLEKTEINSMTGCR